MLTTSKKPYNPNYDTSTADDINWNKSDLLSFLDNIQNVPINDITISGKDIKFYQTATKAQIAAELIGTINLTHYKLLSAVKDVINYNNILLIETKKTNNSIDCCLKQIKELAAQTQRNNFLLLKMAHKKHDLPFGDLKNYTSNYKDTKVNDFNYSNNDEPTPTVIISTTDQTIEQTTQINCVSTNSCANIRNKNSLSNNADLPIGDFKTYIDEPINPIHDEPIDTINDQPIDPMINGSPEQTTDLETTQKNCASENPSAIIRGQNNLLNQPQLNHNTINTIIASPTTEKIDDSHINIFNKVQSKNTLAQSTARTSKPKIKMKKKKKKIKNKNINKRINKKKIKQHKNPKMKITAKNIISNFELEQISNQCTSMTFPYVPNTNKQKRNKGLNTLRNDIDIKTRYGIYRNSKCLEKQLFDILPYEEYIKNEQQAYYELNEQINYAVYNR